MLMLLVINSVLTKMIWLNTGSVEERMVMMNIIILINKLTVAMAMMAITLVMMITMTMR